MKKKSMTVIISESNSGEKTFRTNLKTCGEFHTFTKKKETKTQRERESESKELWRWVWLLKVVPKECCRSVAVQVETKY